MFEQNSETENESVGSLAKQYFGEAVRIIVLSLAIILPVRYFLIQPFYVKGASMEPNFYDHEYLVIDELSYRLHVPTRGEIVVFRPPTGKNDFFIKRVIGLPGETVIVKDGVVTILDQDHPKGYRLDESTYLSGIYTPGEAKVTLSSDEFFLMGDNRSVSLDSRSFGAVPQKNIVGKVWVRGWPIERIGSISTPAYSKE